MARKRKITLKIRLTVIQWLFYHGFPTPSNCPLRRLGFSNPSHSYQKEIWQKGTYFALVKVQTHNHTISKACARPK